MGQPCNYMQLLFTVIACNNPKILTRPEFGIKILDLKGFYGVKISNSYGNFSRST
ncbi:hypothetical protein GCM10010995_19410 [Cysteiniphilum litorale]|uniref:Uncharacterized protein n=1 Tax=Cysteiniphilum litorale TaxID=2056700 RepID=A0A8J3E9K5_9GAMM|nr:hypothetical protein GCM10010995_19410 [Cysteiniphilum litorale]